MLATRVCVCVCIVVFEFSIELFQPFNELVTDRILTTGNLTFFFCLEFVGVTFFCYGEQLLSLYEPRHKIVLLRFYRFNASFFSIQLIR